MPLSIPAFGGLKSSQIAWGITSPERCSWPNFARLAMVAMAISAVCSLATAPAWAAEIYTLATTSAEESFTISFGKVNSTTGEYIQIVGNVSQSAYFSSLAWNPSGSTFWTFSERDLTSISVAGVVGGTVGNVPPEGDGLSWINHGLARSPGGNLYAYNFENDTFGTVTQGSPAYTQIATTGIGTLPTVGGRLAFHGDIIFAAFRLGVFGEPSYSIGAFGTINPATGAFTQLASGAEFESMVLASDGATLFGLTPTTLYSLDPVSGATVDSIALSGDLPENWTGAAVAVPEPSTYVLAMAGLVCGGWNVFRRCRQARR